MRAVKYLLIYLFIVCAGFIGAHFLIIMQPPNTSVGIHINGVVVLLALLAYLIYFFVTPYFFKKIARMSYGKGMLFMCLGMLIAGFFIWLAFGDGDYSTDFYEYEFVSAGLWFCLFNAGFMCCIRFRKSFLAEHKVNKPSV
jgi:hypothetical protein